MSDLKQESSSFSAFIPKKWQDAGWSQGDLSNTLLRNARPGLRDGASALGMRGEQPKEKPVTPDAADRNARSTEKPATDDRQQPGAREDAEQPQARKPEPPQAAQPIIVNQAPVSQKPAFAPTVAAGALSAMMKERAAPDSTAKKIDNNPSKAFQYGLVDDGSEATRARRYHNNTEDSIHQYDAAEASTEFYEQYMMQQQFMQSMEYSVALDTVNRELEECYRNREDLFNQIEDLQEQYEQQTQNIEEIQQQIDEKEQRQQDLEQLQADKNNHMQNAESYYKAKAELDKYDDVMNAVPSVTTIHDGENMYVVRNENGVESYERVDASGNVTKLNGFDDLSDHAKCQMNQKTFMRKNADGNIEYVTQNGDVLDAKKTEQLNQYLKSQGKKPEEALGNYDDYVKARDNPDRLAAEQAATTALNSAAESEQALWKKAEEMGIPIDHLDDLQKLINDNTTELDKLRTQLKQEMDAQKLTKEQMDQKTQELEALNKKIEETQQFKDRLLKGEFKNEDEMKAAMSADLRQEYEFSCVNSNVCKPDPKYMESLSQGTVTAATSENTSRTNGSSTESGIETAVDPKADFAAATQPTAANANDPTLAAPTPEKKVVATAAPPGP